MTRVLGAKGRAQSGRGEGGRQKKNQAGPRAGKPIYFGGERGEVERTVKWENSV